MRRYRFATPAPVLLGLFLAAACESGDVRFEPVPGVEDESSVYDSYSARREFPAGSRVLYAHLGGVPALSAYSYLFRNG